MNDPIIRIQGLSVAYGGQQAVRDVSVDIPARQITAIIGPSGCGKTTLLRSMSRLIELVEASLRVFKDLVEQGETEMKPHKSKFNQAWDGIAERFLKKPLTPPKSRFASTVEASGALLKWIKRTPGVLEGPRRSHLGTGRTMEKDTFDWWNKDTEGGVYKDK